jgi:hypothetical protein
VTETATPADARAAPPPAPAAPTPRLLGPDFPWRALLLLALLATGLRLGTNLSRVDEFFQEGLVRGTLAEAWLRGAPVWPREAPQIPHIRGSVVMSLISVPAFAVLGPTTFAVRLSGIVFHLAGLATLMLLMHRLFGRRAAVLAGALFALAPPALAKIAVLSYGDHVESLPFVFAAAWVTLAWLQDRGGRRTGLGLLAGVLVGLAVSWHAQARLGALALLATCVLLGPGRLLRRDALLGLAPGVLLGLLPLAAGDWITAQQGLLVFGSGPVDMLSRGLDPERLAKWADFWLVDLAHSMQYAWLPAAALLLLLAAGCALGLAARAVSAVRAGRERARDVLHRAAFFVVYPLAFSAVYALSRFGIQYELDNAIQVRYVLPVVPVLLLPIAVAGARLGEAGRTALAACVVGPALLLGAWGSLSTWDPQSMWREPARRACSFEFFTSHLAYGTLDEAERAELRALDLSLYGDPDQEARVRRYVDVHADPEAFLALVARFDDLPEWTRPLRFNLPQSPDDVRGTSDPAAARERLAALPAGQRPYAVAGATRLAGRSRRFDAALAGALARMGTTVEETRAALQGLGQGFLNVTLPRFLDGREVRARLAALPPSVDLREVSFGAGLRVGVLVNAFYTPGDHVVAEYLAHVDPGLHAAFARGLGAAYRWRFLEPPARDLDSPAVARLLALLPPDLEAPFRDGLGGSDRAF